MSWKVSDKTYKEWLDHSLRIRSTTSTTLQEKQFETADQKAARIKALLQPRNFEKFCRYYFGHYVDADFGWFHKQAGKDILTNEDVMAALEWPREHAKSVIVDVFIPMFLKAVNQLSGMILASENDTKAAVLLGDLQAEFLENKLFINDFGEQRTIGNWSEGHFVTTDGIGFWSFGLGQNPAGVRKAAKRPNYGVIDDASNKRRSKNQERIKADVDWVLGDFLGCLAIKSSRIVFANNRTCKNDLMAHLVGDVNEGDPIREGIKHIKVFATEDPRTHKKLLIEDGGVPAWRERYTIEQLKKRMAKMGNRNAMRNFYHEDIADGDIFKAQDLPWAPPMQLDKYDALITYNDPSYKDTGDTKAIVLIGKTGSKYDILWCWVRHASRKSMVQAHYMIDDVLKGRAHTQGIIRGKMDNNSPHYLEANFIQEDLFMEEYRNEGDRRGVQLRIRGDKRSKPDKRGRIEDLTPIAESGCLRFNQRLQKDPDMITLRDQFMAFPNGHDDGPDSVEGAIYLLNKRNSSHGRERKARTGGYRKSLTRRG